MEWSTFPLYFSLRKLKKLKNYFSFYFHISLKLRTKNYFFSRAYGCSCYSIIYFSPLVTKLPVLIFPLTGRVHFRSISIWFTNPPKFVRVYVFVENAIVVLCICLKYLWVLERSVNLTLRPLLWGISTIPIIFGSLSALEISSLAHSKTDCKYLLTPS